MGGSFACPVCGNELALRGTSPGRQVRCGWCETWVEVPFLPRAALPSRFRHSRARRPRWVPWAWAGLGLAACLILLVGGNRMLRIRGRERAERAVAELIASAETDEKAGRTEKALEEMERAIQAEGRLDPPRPDRIAELKRSRDRLTRLHAEARLEAASRSDPAAAIALYRELLSRGWRESALQGLDETIRTRLEQTRRRWAESDAEAARRAVAEGRPNDAIDLCERLVHTIEELPPQIRQPLRQAANALVAELIERRGLLIEPARGQFTLGTPSTYDSELTPRFDLAFRQRGYVPRRSKSTWESVWDRRSPFRLDVEVSERQEGSYIQSRNRLSFLSLAMVLSRSDTPIWRSGPILARTQPSIPSLSAFTASRAVANQHRDDAFEKLLYADARTTLLDRVSQKLHAIPEFRSPTS